MATILVKDGATGKEFKLEATGPIRLNAETVAALNSGAGDLNEDRLENWIENLDLSADWKIELKRILGVTIRIGNAAIEIGKKILNVIISLVATFPNASLGLVVGYFLGSLFAFVPILGTAFVLIGLTIGLIYDIKDMALRRKIRDEIARFEPLRAIEAQNS